MYTQLSPSLWHIYGETCACLDQQEEIPSESPAAAPKHTCLMFLVL